MTIDGRLKIFADSYSLPSAGASIVASSGTDTQDFCLTFDRATYWTSDDALSTETLTITLADTYAIDSLFLCGHNFKDFTITYGDSATDFELVEALASSGTYTGTGIDVSDNYLNTSFFSVREVETNKITITVTAAQSSDYRKELFTFAASLKMGEFSNGSRATIRPRFRPNNITAKNILNKTSVVRGIDSMSADVTISGTRNQNDQWIMEWIFANANPFIFWPCAGIHGEDNFAVDARGFNLEDIYRVYSVDDYRPRWVKDIYISGITGDFSVEEAI